MASDKGTLVQTKTTIAAVRKMGLGKLDESLILRVFTPHD